MKKAVNYEIRRSTMATLLLLLPIGSAMAAEFLAILSSYANTTYSIESLKNVMVLSEIATALLAVMFVVSMYAKGRAAMYIFDVVRIVSVALLCVCFVMVMSERATLMGYVWFSDLESGNIRSVNALNYGAASAALYAVSVILCAVTGAVEFVSAKKKPRTREMIEAEIAELQQELASLEEPAPDPVPAPAET